MPREKRLNLEGRQIAMEEDMLTAVQDKYIRMMEIDPTQGSPEQDLLLRVRQQLAPTYQEWIDKIFNDPPDKFPKWIYCLTLLGPERMADLTIRVLLTCMYRHGGWSDRNNPQIYGAPKAQTVAKMIGEIAHDMAEFLLARKENTDEYLKYTAFNPKWTIKRCQRFKERQGTLINMDRDNKTDFGHTMLRIAELSGIVDFRKVVTKTSNNRTVSYLLVLLQEDVVRTLVEQHEHMIDLLLPAYKPMVCRPTKHTMTEPGGAASMWLRRKTVKQRSFDVDGKLHANLSQMEVDAVNGLQNTEWAINKPILDLIDTMFRSNTCEANLPPYEERSFEFNNASYPVDGTQQEKAIWLTKKSTAYQEWIQTQGERLRVMLRIAEAKRLSKYEMFWHAWFCDFRSRKYTACEMLSPQSGDLDRALLCLAEPRTVSKTDIKWIKVHVANLWDMDKGNFNERIEWVDKNMPMFRAIARDPLEYKKHWVSDKIKKNTSFQRVAAAMDLIQAVDKGITSICVQLDGTTNGAQHWAAMMRDHELAPIVNIVATSRPGDLYGVIAKRATDLCDPNDEAHVRMLEHWSGSIPRACAKRPTMCDPYGITFYGIITYCKVEGNLDWCGEDNLPTYATSLARLLDEALKGVLHRPNAGKEWLRKLSDMCESEDKIVEWETYTGFRVYHKYDKLVHRDSWSNLYTRQKLSMWEYDPEISDPRGARLGISPNFTHSVDASHMTLTVLGCLKAGISQFSMIHDSFGVPAPDVSIMRDKIIEGFHAIHTWSPLERLKETMEKKLGRELEPLPEYGTLRLGDCLGATYMVS